MTDKPIIIDGVDVNGCSNLGEARCTTNPLCRKQEGYCAQYQSCYYKQLQRKTAECEKLKSDLATKCGKDYISEIQDIILKYECHQKSLGMCWFGKYGKETKCIGIKECHRRELEIIKNLQKKLKIATEALKNILDEADILDEFIPKEGYLCGFVSIAQEALEKIGKVK